MKRLIITTGRKLTNALLSRLGFRKCLNCMAWHTNEYFCDGDYNNPGDCYYEYYEEWYGRGL